MRGEVIEFTTSGGVIADNYGARYTFESSATSGPLNIGDQVEFTAVNGVASAISPIAATPEFAPAVAPSYAAPTGSTGAVGGAPYDFTHAMFSFQGRLRRSHFWISWAILFGVGLIAGFIPLLSFALIWPNLAKDVKRLHDMDRSGWWAAIPFGAAFIGIGIFIAIILSAGIRDPQAFESGDSEAWSAMFGLGGLAMLMVFVVQIAFWLWIGITDTQPGKNRFGADPKNPVADAADAFT